MASMTHHRMTFNIISAKEAACKREWGRAMQHYMVVLGMMEQQQRMTHHLAFVTALDNWLLEKETNIDQAMQLLPQLRRLYPTSGRLLATLATRLYRTGDEVKLLECLHLCKEAEHVADRRDGGMDLVAVKIMKSNLMSAAFGQWHMRMINDEVRNEKFEKALKAAINDSSDIVIDIGTGTGILAGYAARHSMNVHALEENLVLCEIAEKVFERNHIAERVTLHKCHSTEFNHKGLKGDVIVAEIMDCCVFGEGIIDTFIDAHQRLASPTTAFIPEMATVYVTVIGCAPIYRLHAVEVNGRQFRSENVRLSDEQDPTSPYWCVTLNEQSYVHYLSEPTPLIGVDFRSLDSLKALRQFAGSLNIHITDKGRADLLVVHFRANLGGNQVLDTSAAGSCWDHGVFPMLNPLPVEPGDELPVNFKLNESRLDVFVPREKFPTGLHAMTKPMDVIHNAHNIRLHNYLAGKLPGVLDTLMNSFPDIRLEETIRSRCYKVEDALFEDPFEYFSTWLVRADGSFDANEYMVMQNAVRAAKTIKMIIPSQLKLKGCLFSSKKIVAQSRPLHCMHGGVDLSPIDEYSLAEFRDIRPAEPSSDIIVCSEEFEIIHFKFDPKEMQKGDPYQHVLKTIDVAANKECVADGVLYWFSSTTYNHRGSQVCAAFLFDEPIELCKGDRATLTLFIHDGSLLIKGRDAMKCDGFYAGSR